MTAISYVNRVGGVKLEKYNSLAREIWQWAEMKKNFLYASYIPSTENIRADKLSRIKNDDTEWELSMIYFNTVVEFFGMPNVDLFANQKNTKCKKLFSWMPDSKAQKIDSFTVNCKILNFMHSHLLI